MCCSMVSGIDIIKCATERERVIFDCAYNCVFSRMREMSRKDFRNLNICVDSKHNRNICQCGVYHLPHTAFSPFQKLLLITH